VTAEVSTGPGRPSAPATVTDLLVAMRGVWVDHLEAFAPDGTPLPEDPYGGKPGPFPYDNIVYSDIDAATGAYRQTNVTFQGRPLHVRSFSGRVGDDGILRFAPLGPADPGHVGVSGGPGVLWFVPELIDRPGVLRYSEPDHIRLLGAGQRSRVTTLYRDGRLVRTMTVAGSLVSDDPTRRLPWDPRGPEGPVHEERRDTLAFSGGTET